MSVTVGGCLNDNKGTYSVLAGGRDNIICASSDSSIIGGKSNILKHNCSFIAGSNITSVSSNMLHAQRLFLTSSCLPTSDPGVAGVVWNDSGTLKISI